MSKCWEKCWKSARKSSTILPLDFQLYSSISFSFIFVFNHEMLFFYVDFIHVIFIFFSLLVALIHLQINQHCSCKLRVQGNMKSDFNLYWVTKKTNVTNVKRLLFIFQEFLYLTHFKSSIIVQPVINTTFDSRYINIENYIVYRDVSLNVLLNVLFYGSVPVVSIQMSFVLRR